MSDLRKMANEAAADLSPDMAEAVWLASAAAAALRSAVAGDQDMRRFQDFGNATAINLTAFLKGRIKGEK